MDILLASASPRRQELLKLIFSDFKIVPADVDETIPCEVLPDDAPEYLAIKKATHISRDYKNDLIIGCDTCVILDNKIFGKPKDKEDAKIMLSALSGKVHHVTTGCCLCIGEKKKTFSVTTEVEFYPLSESEIDKYIETNEPFDKAGAYGIQGYGSLLIKKINGDYFNVVGLPVSRLKREIENF